jgi:hypothetical protein
VLIDCHVHLLPRRRLAGLMKWMQRHDNVWLEVTNVFSSFWDRRYALKEYDTENRLLRDGIGPHSERIMFTLVEIYQTMDRVGLGASVRERLVGGTAERFVKTFWPDFDARDAKARRAESA